MTENVRTAGVLVELPGQLERLRELAYNLRWSWNHQAAGLFERLAPELWESTNHNPIMVLMQAGNERLGAVAQDAAYLQALDRASADLETYQASDDTWFRQSHGDTGGPLVAYFSAEFGLTEALPIYSGGLGVLAADHLKSASDLGLPLVAVSLLYQHGYFRQQLSASGWQEERYDVNDFDHLPLRPKLREDGTRLVVEVPFPDHPVYAQVWQAQVGRIPLFLLDTNIEANRPEDRDITDQLYGGDTETRIRQEIVLGIGGYRVLEQLGLHPSVYHMNEGHSAFLSLERVRRLMETRGISFSEAQRIASAGSVFTTHTPVAAGHDYFSPELMDRYLGSYGQSLGLSRWEFLALGRHNPHDDGEWFCQTVLALRMSEYSNGVSKLHGEVSRQMWHKLYPERPVTDVPVGHVTNGIHLPSFVSPVVEELCNRHLGTEWRQERDVNRLRERFEHIPAAELWSMRRRQRAGFVRYVRERAQTDLARRGEPSPEQTHLLNPDVLTIGFARRFATYKRATLLLRDVERLASILDDPGRPVQVVFAGKAHPRDEGGKELIRCIVELSQQKPFRGRLVFLENYHIGVARRLVQGVDVWLNNPQRPLEASGTSGMKAAANGVLNLSTLDGWWDEAWEMGAVHPHAPGWAIGQGETYEDSNYQEQVDAEALYRLLEGEVAPLFYDVGDDGVPQKWVERMKAAMYLVSPYFNTDRMVQEYTECYYLPAAEAFKQAH